MQVKKPYFAAALIGLLVLGFLATSVVSYFVTHDSLSDRIAEETLPLTSDNIYSEIERDLLRSILISSVMAHDTFLREWAVEGEEDPGRIIRYLKEIQHKYDTTTAFFISEATRRYYHPKGIIKTISRDDPKDAWYFRVRELNEPYEINIDFDTANRSRVVIFINYRVTDFEGDYIGVTGIGLSVDAVGELIESYQRRYGRQIYFIDREGTVTLRGSGFEGPDRIQDRGGLAKFATRILTNPSSSVSYERPDGETVYLNSRLVPEFDWYLVVEQTESAAETRILNTLMLNILVALAITTLVLVIAYFAVRGYQRRLEEMASTDKLTGAANRHVFEMLFQHVVGGARRRGDPVSLLTIDIDGFKGVNDTHGHQGGDAVLRRFTDIVREHIRDSDTLCRWGGDEFLVLLGGCPLEVAAETAEKIRRAVDRNPFPIGGEEVHITLSIGVTEYRDDEGLAILIKRADGALYQSKQQGRNRVSRA